MLSVVFSTIQLSHTASFKVDFAIVHKQEFALVLFNKDRVMNIRLRGNSIERKNWLRYKLYYKLPLFLRPFIYFFYRFIIRLGFLDGKAGFVYHFLQGLWYPFLIDVKYLELRRKKEKNNSYNEEEKKEMANMMRNRPRTKFKWYRYKTIKRIRYLEGEELVAELERTIEDIQAKKLDQWFGMFKLFIQQLEDLIAETKAKPKKKKNQESNK